MLGELYDSVARGAMVERFGYKNVMDVPKLVKVCVNVGLGVVDNRVFDEVVSGIIAITGQRPAVTLARKSIAGFKIRDGQKIGCKVTLRGDRMFHFLERSFGYALPKGGSFKRFTKKQFDGCGNFNMGIKEHTVYPEIEYSKVGKVFGLNVNVVTTAKTDEECRYLLMLLEFPLED